MNKAQMKQVLYEHPYTYETIRELNGKIAELKHIKYDTSVTANISGAPAGGSISKPTENAALKICEYYDAEMWRITKEIRDTIEMARIVDQLLSEMPHRERVIVARRYLMKYNWDQIARIERLTKRHCRRIHDKAIEELCTRFSELNVAKENKKSEKS